MTTPTTVSPLRQRMIEAMGVERYLAVSGAVRVHESETGLLWKRSFTNSAPHARFRPLR